jgi:hypothetical protein
MLGSVLLVLLVLRVGRFPTVPAKLPPLASFPYLLALLAIRPDPQPTTILRRKIVFDKFNTNVHIGCLARLSKPTIYGRSVSS